MKFWLARVLMLAVMAGVACAGAESRPLRVLCWNLQHGVGEDGTLDLARIAAVIRNAKPDLVALQELDRLCARSGRVDQTAELARLTGMTGLFGKAMDYDGGAYGQAILSRHPVTSHQVHALPGTGEPRIAFEAVLTLEGAALRLITVHLGLEAGQRRAQAEALLKLTASDPTPVILCGDFNDTPGSAAHAAFAASWTVVTKEDPVLTYPAATPKVEIDHMFVRGLSPARPLEVLAQAVASDHRPLLAELVRK